MRARILDGQATARDVRAEVKEAVARLRTEHGVAPCLTAVLAGDDPASAAYVGMKRKACGWVGVDSRVETLAADVSQAQVEAIIDRLNADRAVDGVLVQHPLPRHLDESAILARLSPAKDVDGISQSSLGALVAGRAGFLSCTPLGIMVLLERHGIALSGQRAVVIGRSIILGKPMALMLLRADATVTVCHSRTRDLPAIVREGDIVVAAVGRPEMVRGDWLKPGAVLVDAGYNRVEGREGDVGDAHFESCSAVASWITPVPGGVGPMTIAMLLRNTLEAARARVGARSTAGDG